MAAQRIKCPPLGKPWSNKLEFSLKWAILGSRHGSRRPFCSYVDQILGENLQGAYDSPKQLAKRVSIGPPAQPLRGALSTVTAR